MATAAVTEKTETQLNQQTEKNKTAEKPAETKPPEPKIIVGRGRPPKVEDAKIEVKPVTTAPQNTTKIPDNPAQGVTSTKPIDTKQIEVIGKREQQEEHAKARRRMGSMAKNFESVLTPAYESLHEYLVTEHKIDFRRHEIQVNFYRSDGSLEAVDLPPLDAQKKAIAQCLAYVANVDGAESPLTPVVFSAVSATLTMVMAYLTIKLEDSRAAKKTAIKVEPLPVKQQEKPVENERETKSPTE
jgi:hypothetical protein